MNKAIFLDKDGTLIPDIPYNVNPGLIQLSENASKGLIDLYRNGYLLIVISNQSGVAKGYFEEGDLKPVETRLNDLLAVIGVKLSGVYFCYHHPEGIIEGYNTDCTCRKPHPGMLVQAAKDHDVNLSNSWMIGDILNDIEAGNRAGCRTVLIDNGNETEWIKGGMRTPEFVCKSINEAAAFIQSTAL